MKSDLFPGSVKIYVCLGLLILAGCGGDTTTVNPPGETVPAPRLGE